MIKDAAGETISSPSPSSSQNKSDASPNSISKSSSRAVYGMLTSKLFVTSSPPDGHLDKQYHEGSAWNISDFPDNNTFEVVERLSRTQYHLSALVELAKESDPEGFARAHENVCKEQQLAGVNKWSTTPVEELVAEFESNIKNGLSDAEVVGNRQKYGPNVLEKENRMPVWRIFVEQFTSPVVILLLVAMIVSLGLQEWPEGIVISLILLLNATLATYMEKSAGDALAELASLAAPHCNVLRNGNFVEIDAVDLVPGDIVKLGTGDAVPADVRCIQIAELKANEAILTGESEDVKKTLIAKDPQTPFATNLCFASTSITNGTSINLVYATGMATQVGKIAEQLAKEAKGGSKLTPMQRNLNKLGGLIAVIAIAVLIVIVVIAILTKYQDPSHPDKNPYLSILLIAVGFCVSSIPEGLPMVVTICLSLGCKDMVKRNSNVRKLPAVETLGSCTVICSDKTGTLTEGKMTAIKLVAIGRGVGKSGATNVQQQNARSTMNLSETFGFFPTKGFNPNGGIFLDSDLTNENRNKIVAKWDIGINEYDDVSIDYGNPQHESIKGDLVRGICLAGFLNSTSACLEKDKETQQWTTKGNMSEGALVVAAAKARWAKVEGLGMDGTKLYPSIEELEVPFSSSRKMMATVHRLQQNNYFDRLFLESPDSSFSYVALIKGAPDKVIQSAKHALKNVEDVRLEIDWSSTALSTDEVSEIVALNDRLSEASLRVLSFALVPLADEDLFALREMEESESRLSYLLNGPVVMLGLIGSLDPPRVGVKEAIQECFGAGIKVVMITGDQKPTASAIGKSIGLIHSGLTDDDHGDDEALLCSALHENEDPSKPFLDNENLDEIISRVRIFSRAQPEDKIAIVHSFRRQGEVVAMTGDGVNDAPALKAAHIGVAMGITGTDVAKGAADMILMDDNFCTIISAVEEAAGMKMPVEALQILFLNMMSDGCPAVALTREPADGVVMQRPPRNPKEHLMTKDWWVYGIIPHTIFEAACVIGSLVVAMYLATGAVLNDDINSQCLSSEGIRYYCQSAEYVPGFLAIAKGRGSGFYTSIDYWDPTRNEFVQLLRARPGHPKEKLSPADFGLSFPDCQGWCIPASVDLVDLSYPWVNARGSRIATTQSFITAVYCEALRAYTVRSWEFFLFVFNRNPWMHFACSLSGTMTLMITVIPGLHSVFGLVPIAWWQYFLSFGWAIINLVLDEMIPKPIYRSVLRKRQEAKSKELKSA